MTPRFHIRCILTGIFAVVLLASCRHKSPYIVDVPKWRLLGSDEPGVEDIAHIRSAITEQIDILKAELTSQEVHTRRRAAYVAECVGTAAAGMTSPLLDALEVEKDPVNQAYFSRALAEVAPDEPIPLERLRAVFARTENEIVKTYLASAIMTIAGLSESVTELQYVLDQLNPDYASASVASDQDRNDRWEQQWGAAYMIAKLGPAAAALVPAFERLTEQSSAPPWVTKQAWFTLRAISPRPGRPGYRRRR